MKLYLILCNFLLIHSSINKKNKKKKPDMGAVGSLQEHRTKTITTRLDLHLHSPVLYWLALYWMHIQCDFAILTIKLIDWLIDRLILQHLNINNKNFSSSIIHSSKSLVSRPSDRMQYSLPPAEQPAWHCHVCWGRYYPASRSALQPTSGRPGQTGPRRAEAHPPWILMGPSGSIWFLLLRVKWTFFYKIN